MQSAARQTVVVDGMALAQELRGEIAAGTYDSQEKWEAALDRLLDRLERD